MNSLFPRLHQYEPRMEETMRWFGPGDPVSLMDIQQSGCTGVVSALHHIPIGEIWSREEIQKRRQEIELTGLTWSVVESVPVSESLKTKGDHYKSHLENYKKTIQNLGILGIKVLTYNFMPVLDWTRTKLDYTLSNGAKALYFEKSALNAFDLFILKRPKALEENKKEDIDKAKERFDSMSESEKKEIQKNILAGLPGAEAHFDLDSFQKALEPYHSITEQVLRQNLLDFLSEIVPVAEEAGVKLALHPDDPPYPLFGLPRVVSTSEDYEYISRQIPSLNNGICFCTGSLGVRKDNNLVKMIQKFQERIHFLHLRSTHRLENGDFYEEGHLEGDVDMYEIVEAIFQMMRARKASIPMRPDHGHQILDDLKKEGRPGYYAVGRLKGLAEIRGLELGIRRSIEAYENRSGKSLEVKEYE